MSKRTLDAATLRRLAVKADVDPRTIARALRTESFEKVPLSMRRALKTLKDEGYKVRDPDEK
jgi:hypothetical protein